MDSGWRKKEFYEIRLEGHLSPSWSAMFDGMQLNLTQDGETILSGAVTDQSALHGLLARIQVCYCGDLSQGERVLAPLRKFGPPLVDRIQPMPYSGSFK